jgi:hypothetical protein
MMERQERTALLLLIGVAILVLVSYGLLSYLGTHYFASPFTNASTDGELVQITGEVSRIAQTREGGHLILTVRGVPVFVPQEVAGHVEIEQGVSVLVYGVVQTYRGEKEIVVKSADDIVIQTR